jgi:Leucine-rich repeat (LRR) protein
MLCCLACLTCAHNTRTANNWLNGSIPDALRSLKRLQTLGLGTNFLSGPTPIWLGELKALQTLNLGANAGDNPDGTQGLTGTLPDALSDLPDLSVLNVETNALVGSIPRQLCKRNKLTVLKLRSNQLEGAPTHITQCTQLTQLDISSNRWA